MKLNNIKIGSRLALGFATLLLLLCTLGAATLWRMSRVYDGTLELANDWLPSVQAASRMQALANNVRRTSLRALLSDTEQIQKAQRAEHDESITTLTTVLADYQKLVSSPEEQQIYEQIKSAWASYAATDAKIFELVSKGADGIKDARDLSNGKGSAQFVALLKLIDADIELNRIGSVQEVTHAAESYHNAVLSSSILIVIAMMAGLSIGVVITRSITTPIARAVAIAQTVAEGDLTTVIHVTGKDETSQLLHAMGNMNDRLVDIVGKVRSSSDSIATGSAQIAAGNTDLSQRTEEQAASLEETAASMEELTATVRQNAENAMQGNVLAASASEVAARGGQVVSRVVDTMGEISRSSQQVAQIISVIEGIAFQTNILALNAAVEAARAGEQGRGFAVVAGEVRTLAQRSAAAAKEIKDLIGASVEHVSSGSKLVEEAGRTMSEVVQSVRRVTDLMGEISAASREQHTGIEQVNQAVGQMDEVTQQNAALVEEASAAAQSMEAQSSTLRDLVSVFRIDSGRLVPSQDRESIASCVKPARVSEAKTHKTPQSNVLARSAAETEWHSF